MDSPPSVVPVEIWAQIHALACTDDGSAGRALSLVSKEWRNISAPYKFQSIALIGPKPILRCLALLETNPESPVLSLFIGCQNLRMYSPDECRLDLARESARGLVFTDKLFPELATKYPIQTVQIHADAIEQAVLRILARVAGTLHTLYTHLTFVERPDPLYSVPFHHLRTLVLHGPFASPPPTLPCLTPNLRRLRLASPLTSPHKSSVLLNTVAAAAPRLSHLYLPHTACARKDLERALERTAMRNLTRLVVEVGTARRSRSPPGHQMSESAERAGLLRLARDDGRIRIVKERHWWLDVQAALIEWEQVDESRWDDREEVDD